MLQGNPRLAVWTVGDNTLRIFELATDESAFVQVGSGALTHVLAALELPFLGFTKEGDRVLATRQNTAVSGQSKMTAYSLDAIATADVSFGAISNGNFKSFLSEINNILGTICITGTASSGNSWKSFNADVFTNQGSGPWFSDAPCVGMTADENFLLGAAPVLGFCRMYRANAKTLPTDIPVFGTFGSMADMTIVPLAVDFTPNSVYMVVGGAGGVIECWSLDFTTYATQEHVFTEAGVGDVVHVACRFDSRYVAVSFNNAGTYTTCIYKRQGGMLQKTNTLAGFGKLLEWSADGRFLIDGGLKKAYKRNSDATYTATDALMANLPASVVVQAVSGHERVPVPLGSLYSAAVEPLTLATYDADNIKVMLLNNSAIFTVSDTTSSAVSNAGAYEVSGHGWPVGGVPFENVDRAPINTSQVGLTADPARQIIFGGNITFRKALIYDATNDTPLVFVDFGEDRVVEENYTAVISPASDALVRWLL